MEIAFSGIDHGVIKEEQSDISELVKSFMPLSNTYQAFTNKGMTEFSKAYSIMSDLTYLAGIKMLHDSIPQLEKTDLAMLPFVIGLGIGVMKIASYSLDRDRIRVEKERLEENLHLWKDESKQPYNHAENYI